MAVRKRTRAGRAVRADGGPDPQGERERVLEFRFSRGTVQAIEGALRGLTPPQQERVWQAIDGVSDEVGDKVARAIERNVIGNANELLEVLTPAFAAGGRWSDLRAIWTFLERLDVPVNHERIARSLEKAHGAPVATRYRETAGSRPDSGRGSDLAI
jgi:hypothetical protein